MLQTPAIATAIAHELGTDQAAAFDISAACAGFCHGVALASDMVRAGSAGYALVIGVERLSDLTDVGDRGTAFIFADGAGAAVVGPERDPGHRPGRLGLRRRAVRPDPAARGLARRDRRRAPRDAPPGHAGQPGLPLGVVRDGQDRPAGPRPRRHHRRRPRLLRPPPGQHADHRRDGPRDEAARDTSRSPATSPSRATPRRPRSRSRSTGCTPRATRSPATSPC